MAQIRVPRPIWIAGVAACLYGWAQFISTFKYPGSIGLDMIAPGTEWTVFYSAARLYWDGGLDILFNGSAFTRHLNAVFADWWVSTPLEYHPWVYPPSFLLILLPFGHLSFVASYAAFVLATASLLAAAVSMDAERRDARWMVIGTALLCPAAAINVTGGQNAFLIAALLVAGFRRLNTAPVLAGIVLGLATIKPQFWILVPVALLGARQWVALASALASAGALAAVSGVVLGMDLWRKWFAIVLAGGTDGHAKWVEAGRIWGMSIYACVNALGAPSAVASLFQLMGTLLTVGLVFMTFRGSLPRDRKLAILLAATFLGAPHSSIQDALLPAIAAALWIVSVRPSQATIGRWMLALILVDLPQFNPPLIARLGILSPMIIVAFIVLALRDASEDNSAVSGLSG